MLYTWFTRYHTGDIYDDYYTCKESAVQYLQNLVNTHGHPILFDLNIVSFDGIVNDVNFIKYNDELNIINNSINIDLYLKPIEIVHPPFRYIDYKDRWCIYGFETKDDIVNVYSSYGMPSTVRRGKQINKLENNNDMPYIIYDITSNKPNKYTPLNNMSVKGMININDFKLYHPGDKITVTHNNKNKTFFVKFIYGDIALVDYKLRTNTNNKQISVLYHKDDHTILDKLKPHIKRNFNIIYHDTEPPKFSLSSIEFDNKYVNNCNVILYTKNSINDPLFNHKIGKILTLDLPFMVICVNTKPTGILHNNNNIISVSSKLYPEEINETIKTIKRTIIDFNYMNYTTTHLLHGNKNNIKYVLNNLKRPPFIPELIELIYRRYADHKLKDKDSIKLLDQYILKHKSLLPDSLYKNLVKDAKTRDRHDVTEFAYIQPDELSKCKNDDYIQDKHKLIYDYNTGTISNNYGFIE